MGGCRSVGHGNEEENWTCHRCYLCQMNCVNADRSKVTRNFGKRTFDVHSRKEKDHSRFELHTRHPFGFRKGSR